MVSKAALNQITHNEDNLLYNGQVLYNSRELYKKIEAISKDKSTGIYDISSSRSRLVFNNSAGERIFLELYKSSKSKIKSDLPAEFSYYSLFKHNKQVKLKHNELTLLDLYTHNYLTPEHNFIKTPQQLIRLFTREFYVISDYPVSLKRSELLTEDLVSDSKISADIDISNLHNLIPEISSMSYEDIASSIDLSLILQYEYNLKLTGKSKSKPKYPVLVYLIQNERLAYFLASAFRGIALVNFGT